MTELSAAAEASIRANRIRKCIKLITELAESPTEYELALPFVRRLMLLLDGQPFGEIAPEPDADPIALAHLALVDLYDTYEREGGPSPSVYDEALMVARALHAQPVDQDDPRLTDIWEKRGDGATLAEVAAAHVATLSFLDDPKAPEPGEVYVVLSFTANGSVELEVLSGPPQWDTADSGQAVFVANVNGGDSVPFIPTASHAAKRTSKGETLYNVGGTDD